MVLGAGRDAAGWHCSQGGWKYDLKNNLRTRDVAKPVELRESSSPGRFKDRLKEHWSEQPKGTSPASEQGRGLAELKLLPGSLLLRKAAGHKGS